MEGTEFGGVEKVTGAMKCDIKDKQANQIPPPKVGVALQESLSSVMCFENVPQCFDLT
jgi:hypothetical protein